MKLNLDVNNYLEEHFKHTRTQREIQAKCAHRHILLVSLTLMKNTNAFMTLGTPASKPSLDTVYMCGIVCVRACGRVRVCTCIARLGQNSVRS